MKLKNKLKLTVLTSVLAITALFGITINTSEFEKKEYIDFHNCKVEASFYIPTMTKGCTSVK